MVVQLGDIYSGFVVFICSFHPKTGSDLLNFWILFFCSGLYFCLLCFVPDKKKLCELCSLVDAKEIGRYILGKHTHDGLFMTYRA